MSPVALAALAGAFFVGCSSSPPSPHGASGGADERVCPSTPEEERYGCGPIVDGSITYQPEVVIVEGGAAAVRDWSADGLTWTIDGGAPGAEKLAPGRIMLLTTMAAGRVLGVRHSGTNRMVTLGPAPLGEIISDGELTWSAPIRLENAQIRVAPDLPATVVDSSVSGISGAARRQTASHAGATAAFGASTQDLPLFAPRPNQSVESFMAADAGLDVRLGPGTDFHPYCCAEKIGADFSLDESGIRIGGSMWLRVENASLEPYLRFRKGELLDGTIVIRGIKGLYFDFMAASSPDGPPANIERDYLLPAEFTPERRSSPDEPVMAQGIMQFWTVKTAFSAGSSSLEGSAEYDFNTDVMRARFNDRQGIVDFSLPTGFTAKTKLLDTLTGLSVGVNGLDILLSVRICVCYGAFVAADGLFIQLSSGIGATNDSSAVALVGGRCRGAAYGMAARIGNGHRLYQGFVDGLNDVLKTNGAKESIAPQAGYVSDPIVLWDEAESIPAGFRRCQY